MYTTKEYPPENDDYKKPTIFDATELKNIKFWHLALTTGTALFASLFAVRLGYLSKINDYTNSLKLAKWNELFPSLQTSGADVANLAKINQSFTNMGVSHEKLNEIGTAIKCASGDVSKWTGLTEPFVAYCKKRRKFCAFRPTIVSVFNARLTEWTDLGVRCFCSHLYYP